MRWVRVDPDATDGAGRRRLHDGRHRPRDARVRPRGAGGHHLDDRRRPAARRRRRPPDAEVRPVDRQRRRRGRRARRRQLRARERGREPGPLLGDPRRRRQLRRRHVAHACSCTEQSTVVAGPIIWPLDQAAEVLAWYREFMPGAARRADRLLRVPLRSAGAAVPGGAAPAEGVRRHLVLRRRRRRTPTPRSHRRARWARRLLDGVHASCRCRRGTAPSTALYPRGRPVVLARRLLRRDPGRGDRDCTSSSRKKLPTWKSTMHLYPSDGAAARVAPDATPWAYRDAKWTGVFAGVDPDPANADAIKAWTIDYYEALHPYSMGGSYVELHDGRGSGARAGDVRRRTTRASPRSRRSTTRTTSST